MVWLHEIGSPQFYPVGAAGQMLGDHILPNVDTDAIALVVFAIRGDYAPSWTVRALFD